MRIAIDNFGGIIPSKDAMSLPENAAQVAHNVDLSGGTLRPWQSVNAFSRLHDDAGDMVAGINADDIAIIPKASAVTCPEFVRQCIPWYNRVGTGYYGWVWTSAFVFVHHIDPDSGEIETQTCEYKIFPFGINYTSTGFTFQSYLWGSGPTIQSGIRYTVSGPVYQIRLYHDEVRLFRGGPDADYTFPYNATSGDSQIPDIAVPLIYPTSMSDFIYGEPEEDKGHDTPTSAATSTYQYGTLQCDDVSGPQLNKIIEAVYREEPTTWTNYRVIPGFTTVTFTFNCNYIRDRQQQSYYVQQMVDDSDRDGPESDVSSEIIIPLGKIAMLSTPLTTGYTKNRLYRSANAGSGFLKIEDVDGTTFYDDLRQSLTDDLPPSGNIPHVSVAEAVKGAVKHPAGYAVYYSGNELRPSSEWIDLERPWAVPEEYAYAFDSTIQCIALIDATVLVFTEQAVYKVHGQHPARLAIYKISDKPILDIRSLWTTHSMVGWVTEEGIVVFAGGVPQLLTSEFYRAEEWQALQPETFAARTNDKALCLFNSAELIDNLRFDLRGPRDAAISTFDSFDGTATYEWKSRIFQHKKPVSWYAARVVAEVYPIRLRLFADKLEAAEMLILDGKEVLLPRMAPARRWEVSLEGSGETRALTIASSAGEV